MSSDKTNEPSDPPTEPENTSDHLSARTDAAPAAVPATDGRHGIRRSVILAGAVVAVLAALALTFGAGVWAGTELGEEHHDTRSHSRQRADSEQGHGEDRVRAPGPALPVRP